MPHLADGKGECTIDHHGSFFLPELLCLCYSLEGMKPRCVIAIITDLCSVPPELPTNPAPPAPATWGLQTDVAVLSKTDSNNFSFQMGRVSQRAVLPGTECSWSSLVCGQKMRCELVTSWERPLGSSGIPTVSSSLKHPWLRDFVPLSQCSDGFGQNYVLGEN